METHEDTQELIAEIVAASQAYYQDGEDSGMTDEEYDAKVEYASTLVDSYPDLFAPGTDGYAVLENEVAAGSTVKSEDTVKHDVPMLSLGKAKTEDEIKAFASKIRKSGASSFMLQAKLDGFAVSSLYVDGKVKTLSTRGDGILGENATHLLTADNLSIVGLPRTIDMDGEVEIRGEIFFTNSQFEFANKNRVAYGEPPFKNSRNAVSGLQKRALAGIPFKVEFYFSAYTLLVNSEYRDLSELDPAVETVAHLTSEQAGEGAKLSGLSTDDELLDAIAKFGTLRESFAIPTDGVVVKPTNEGELLRKLGANSHHPVSQIAFKYPSVQKKTEVLAIDLTVGKTGRITPIARVSPVDLNGWETWNASLHNFNWAISRGIRVGSSVIITRANDVIPQVVAVVGQTTGSKDLELPTECPVCGVALSYDTTDGIPRLIQCKNFECPSRKLFALRTACGRDYLDIDGLSGILLEALAEAGVLKTVADLFRMEPSDLEDTVLGYTSKGNPRRLGLVRAKKIVAQAQAAKTKPLVKLLASLGIEGLGRSASKKLQAKFGTLEGIRAATFEEIASIDSLGDVTAQKIVDGLQRSSDVIDEMIKLGVQFDDDASSTGSRLEGLSFAISGSVPSDYGNRQAFVDFIESEGGSFHSSPKAETSYMIADPDGSSSKIKKAHSLGIEFLAPEDFDTVLAD